MIQLTKYASLRRIFLILNFDTGKTVTAQDYRGKVVMLYFGYIHCLNVRPITMARLAEVILGEGR